jgi:DMSO reductase family type II enzyme heme b subunit
MRTIIIILSLLLLTAPLARAAEDAERGKAVYATRCAMCHGEEGEGDGPGAKRLVPPPRDFSEGQYKFKTTGFDDAVPNDADLVRMIRDGMPGTAMPGWADVLSEQDIADVTAYIKIFAGLEEEKPSDQIDYGTPVETSPESVAKGKKLFLAGERCSECHGNDGKGDAVKKLKDDSGNRTWPRNLTKPWTFRASNSPKDIFTRISGGIPGTQMPSFADPKSKKKLSVEERWHVANYVVSLAKTERTVRAENIVVKAVRIDGALPPGQNDEKWALAPSATFAMVPQIIVKPRFFTPANDTITVRALYNDKAVALLLEWDDRTKSIPGDQAAQKIADENMGEDAVAVQLPVVMPKGLEKPYFGMGDAAKPVSLWKWRSGSLKSPETAELYTGIGFGELDKRELTEGELAAKGAWRDGTWRVVLTRPLNPPSADNDIALKEGKFVPIAFSAWDGSNGERDGAHTLSTWYWLLLEPSVGSKPIVAALLSMVLVFGLLVFWARGAARRRGG